MVFGAYMQHVVCAKGWIELTTFQLKGLIYFEHLILVVFMIANATAGLEGMDFAVMQGFHCTIRFSFIFMFCYKEVPWPVSKNTRTPQISRLKASRPSHSKNPPCFSPIVYSLFVWIKNLGI